jgi:PadR family transcriptional regulator, regulatory protein PadR
VRGGARRPAAALSSPGDESLVGLPRNFLRPCLLLLLAEGTGHGYELLDSVRAFGLERVDPGGLYRCLRAMDEEGLVRSTWEPSVSGPARRTYALTEEGLDWLHVVAGSLTSVVRSLAVYQQRYEQIAEQSDAVP